MEADMLHRSHDPVNKVARGSSGTYKPVLVPVAINRHQGDLPQTVLGYEVGLFHICVYDARRTQADMAAMKVEEVWKGFGRCSEGLNPAAIAFVPT